MKQDGWCPPKKALIWGCTGQDGSFLSELLLTKGYEVTGVARRVSVDTTTRLAIAKQHDSFRLLNGDVTDAFSVYRIIAETKPDEIYNLAAQSHVGVSFNEPAHTWDVTAKGCLNILEAIRELHCYANDANGKKVCVVPKFYQASSSEMFGSAYSTNELPLSNGTINARRLECGIHEVEERFQNETTTMLPNSPYAVAKLAAHNAIRVYRDSYGLFACSGILFNHESCRRGEQFVTKKISLWVAKLYQTIKIHCPTYPRSGGVEALIRNPERKLKLSLGNLDAYRDWGYAPDYVEAMWLMLQQPKADDFVISSGEAHTVREFVTAALDVIGFNDSICKGNLTLDDLIESDTSLLRPNEVPYLRGDSTKARNELGWAPKHSFKDLVKKMVVADLASTTIGGCR